MSKINQRLYFKESPTSSNYELLHKAIENGIFFRWMFFKNRPRSTFFLVRALLTNTLVFATYYAIFSNIKFLIVGIDVDPFLLYTASVAVTYFSMSMSFSSKTQYLSNLYNQVIDAAAEKNDPLYKLRSVNFAIQLMTMDLWGHRLYSWVLQEALNDALSELAPEKSLALSQEINSGKANIAQVRGHLFQHQRKLMGKEPSNPYLKAV